MADNKKAQAPSHTELLHTVEKLDRDNDKVVTLDELRKSSKEQFNALMGNLRLAAQELRTETNPGKEKVESLRKTLERLEALNIMKARHEKEIQSVHKGEMKDFYDLFNEIRTRLEALKTDVDPGKKGAEPATEAVVVPKWEKKAVPAVEKKESASALTAKRDFLLADESLFQNSKGERTTAFGRAQLKKLLADPRFVADETEFDRLVVRLAGAPINVQNEEESKAVRAKFVENLSLRLTAISSLYERTVGEKLGDKTSGGGLLHILKGQEGELVKRMFDVAEKLEKKGEGKGWNVTLEDVTNTLKSIGLGAILGPVYLDWRSHKGIASQEIKTGEKTDKFGIATSDSKQNVEARITPAFKLFGFAFGIAVEVNANLNDREREIIGKVEEAAKAYDSLIDPESGKMNESQVPAERLQEAKDFNRALLAMSTGDVLRDKAVSKALRDAYLFELTDRLVRDNVGWEPKGVGAGIALLFGVLPLKAFVKVNGENLSAQVKNGKIGTLSAFDSVRLGKGALDKYGIARTETPEGYEYRIDPKKGYKIENRTDLKIEDGLIKSKKPLYFKHLEVVSDSMKEGEDSVSTLLVSAEPIDAAIAEASGANGRESIYVAASNDQLRSEVMNAMWPITSRHIREKATGIQTLQEAIAKAYASGNPETAYKLLSHVKVDGKKPLAALAALHSLDTPADKRELLNMVLQETAGDWRIRSFDAIKTRKDAFEDFVKRTGYRGTQKGLTLADVRSAWDHGATFDKNFVAKTGLAKASKKDQQEAVAAIGNARKEFSAPLGKFDAIEKRSRTITNAIGFVNFHQVAMDAEGKTHKRFQDIVPVAGTVKTVDLEPTAFENAAIRRELVAKIPKFVLESLLQTINAQAEKVGVAKISSVEDVRKLLISNGSNSEGAFRPDIQLTSGLAYTRFAKCLNDTYLIQGINLCVTGPNGQTVCAPTIPEVTSDLLATVGTKETQSTNVAVGAAFNTGIGEHRDGGGPRPNSTTPDNTNTPIGGGTVNVPSTPGSF